MNEKSKPFASLQIGQSTETPVVDIYRDSKTDHGMIKDHEDGTWIRLEDYVALNRQLTSALAREKQLSAQKDYDNSEAEEAIRNHIATKNGWLCKYNEAQGELANTVKLLNARTEEYNYAVRSNQEQFKELEALTAERDEALKSRNEREAELGRLVQQMEKDDDEYEAQLTQARSELETVKRERERLLFDISEQKSNYGNAELVWSDRLNEARKHLTAAQQTITELNCKLAKYEKK